MSKREQGRVLALQALYQWDLRGDDFEERADEFVAESTKDPEVYFFARELVFGAWDYRHTADRLIKLAAAHWDMRRMAAVDRNILRLAIYEMLGRDDIPARVAIDQAIELAKRFGAAESGAFVNGILDNVLRTAKPELVAESDKERAAGGRGKGPRSSPVRNEPLEVGAPGVVAVPADEVLEPSGRGEDGRPGDQVYPDIKNWDEE